MKQMTREFFSHMCEEATRFGMAKAEREKEKERLMDADDWDGVAAWRKRDEQFKDPYTSGQYKAYWAYRHSSEIGSAELLMDDSLWEKEVKDFSDTLRAAGVMSFVITNQSTGLMDDIFALEAQGWMLAGTRKVTVSTRRWGTETTEELPGLRLIDMR